ncbi:MAG: hypothetical protein ACK4V6_19345 [Microthrixaceae bacterium]
MAAGAVRRGAAVTGALRVAGAAALADELVDPDERDADEGPRDPLDGTVPPSTCTYVRRMTTTGGGAVVGAAVLEVTAAVASVTPAESEAWTSDA